MRLLLDVECDVEDLGPLVSREDALELSVLRVCGRLARGELSMDSGEVVDASGRVVGEARLVG